MAGITHLIIHYPFTYQPTPIYPKKTSSYIHPIHKAFKVYFNLDLYFPGWVGVVGMVIIRLKANSVLLSLPSRREFGIITCHGMIRRLASGKVGS